jgi:hypothetical protein
MVQDTTEDQADTPIITSLLASPVLVAQSLVLSVGPAATTCPP